MNIFGKYPPPTMNGIIFMVNIRERSEKEQLLGKFIGRVKS